MKIRKAKGREKGFTLVELAIVLVIIGIILGAVIKGQDLINNARAKRFTSELRKWEVVLWTYYDRHHHFPQNKDKLKGLADQLQNPVNFGGQDLYFGFGKYNGKEVLLVCGDASCSSDNATDLVLFLFRNADISIDGVENATAGLVRGVTGGGIDSDNWIILNSSSIDVISSDNWTGATGLVYYLDSQALDDED